MWNTVFQARQPDPPAIVDDPPQPPSLIYEPLDLDDLEIRLLTLLPRNTGYGVYCTLEKISLIDPGPYIALSYCWGDASDTIPITVNDVKVGVTVNLEAALRHLTKKRSVRIWVDALCINQNDRLERGLQIRSMRQIYAKATMVVAWVGSASADSTNAIRLLKAQEPRDLLQEDKGGLEVEPRCEARSQSHPPQILDNFFDRPYWKRVWIIQELAVASHLSIQCGYKTISWEELLNADAIYQIADKEGSNFGDSYSYVKRILAFRRKVSENEKISLVEAMGDSQEALSTDARDKIFALLGLCYDSEALVPTPNYRQSVEEILMDMTIAMMKMNRSLDVLLLRSTNGDRQKSSPYWVPDWLGRWPKDKAAQFAMTKTLGQKEFKIRAPPVKDIFVLTGRIIGTVASTTGRSWVSRGRRHASKDTVCPSLEYYETLEGLIDIVWQSLCFGKCDNGDAKTYREYFSVLLESRDWAARGVLPQLRSWLLDNAEFPIDNYTIAELAESAKVKHILGRLMSIWRETGFANQVAFNNAVADTIVRDGMQLVVLDCGPLGMAHGQTREGDVVCDITGFGSHVVLRETEGCVRTHRVVGQARINEIYEESRSRHARPSDEIYQEREFWLD
jgi:hypothetical protein